MLLASSVVALAIGIASCSHSPTTSVPGEETTTSAPSAAMPDHTMMMDLGPKDTEFDLRFINTMIPHHEGALVMAQQVLEHSDLTELQQLAQAILQTLQQEIDQMKQWRQDWYGQ